MLDFIQNISKTPAVNGSEFHLSDFLKEYFLSKGLYAFSDCGNNVMVQNSKESKPRVCLFTPMDSPGYICLYRDEEKTYLTPTSKALAEVKDIDSVVDLNGKCFDVQKSDDNDKTLVIQDVSNPIGTAYLPFGQIRISKSSVEGRFSARLACISILKDLAESVENENVALCFTTGFQSGSKAECNVLNRKLFDIAVFLGFNHTEEKTPILAIKDGKSFSSPSLCERFYDVCRDHHLMISKKVFDQSVTAAERTSPQHHTAFLSLVLPCCDPLTQKESVSISAMKDLTTALRCFLNNI